MLENSACLRGRALRLAQLPAIVAKLGLRHGQLFPVCSVRESLHDGTAIRLSSLSRVIRLGEWLPKIGIAKLVRYVPVVSKGAKLLLSCGSF